MNLLYKASSLKEGYQVIVSPENAPLKYLEFGRLLLKEEERYSEESKDREIVLDILRGKSDIEIEDEGRKINWSEVGGRTDVFSSIPTVVYIPKGTKYLLKSCSNLLEIAIFKAPAKKKTSARLIRPEEVKLNIPGSGNWKRKVYTCVGKNVEADRILFGETFNPPGNWSSYPPHKHDIHNPPHEAPLEEIYFFQIKPSQGFGIQRIYTSPDEDNPLNEVYVIENNDTIVIPRGYHPVVAAAGYQLCYLWCLAGEERRYGAWSDDPKHSWVKEK
ncbi:5-deoxy-glucuronate isomerase [Candidatus Aerophobetes bacterium]|nr:5-deoxy-glucuronate isomerase [Candidatus Aerophobetes bacterium]